MCVWEGIEYEGEQENYADCCSVMLSLVVILLLFLLIVYLFSLVLEKHLLVALVTN